MYENIMNVTKQLIRTNGMQFTISAIAKELRISSKTIYKHFVNKEEIILAIIHELKNESDTYQMEVLNDDSISHFCKLNLLLTRLPRDYDIINYRNTVYIKLTYPRAYELMLNIYKEDWNRFEEVYKAGMKHEDFREIDLVIFKEMYIASITQLPLLQELSEYNHKELLTRIVSLLLNGVKLQS